MYSHKHSPVRKSYLIIIHIVKINKVTHFLRREDYGSGKLYYVASYDFLEGKRGHITEPAIKFNFKLFKIIKIIKMIKIEYI